MVSEENLTQAKRAWEAFWKAGNFDALGELFTPTCVLTTDDGVCTGREGDRNYNVVLINKTL